MPNLKNCPFCGSDKTICKTIDIEEPDYQEEQDFYFILCAECEAQGPLKTTQEKAEKAWNRPGRKTRRK